MPQTVTYEAVAVRIGFNLGPYGPWAVTVYCDDVTPPIADPESGFQLDHTEARTLNGVAVTLQELIIDLCGQFDPRVVKVRIVWDEHRYGNVREAHFTTGEAKT